MERTCLGPTKFYLVFFGVTTRHTTSSFFPSWHLLYASNWGMTLTDWLCDPIRRLYHPMPASVVWTHKGKRPLLWTGLPPQHLIQKTVFAIVSGPHFHFFLHIEKKNWVMGPLAATTAVQRIKRAPNQTDVHHGTEYKQQCETPLYSMYSA